MTVLLQLKFLGLSLLVLAEIAASVAYVNHIVRFKSGIDNNETLRRVWSKPEQIVFQPILLPILLSWIVCLGVNSLVRSIMIGFLQMIDVVRVAGKISLAGDFAVTVSGTAAGTIAGTLIYIFDGGVHLIYQVAGMLAVSLAISLPRIIVRAPASVIATWVVAITAIVICISVWIKSRGVVARVSTLAVRELRPNSLLNMALPQQSRLRFILQAVGCMLLLVALRLADGLIIAYIKHNTYEEIYLAQVLRNFAGLMVLIGCCFVVILIANASVIQRIFIWQWPSVLVPMLVLGPCETLLMIFGPYHREFGWSMAVSLVKRTFMYAAAGFLGAAVYLGVLARAASLALDPGMEGQSELIVDDDEDSEYEV